MTNIKKLKIKRIVENAIKDNLQVDDVSTKAFLFRGKTLSFKAVKSEMTNEIVKAFDDYESQTIAVPVYDDKGELQKKPKKFQIADEMGSLMDSVSVDPSTGEVELVMSNVLPVEHIGGAPFPLQENDEYEGIPVVEWRDPDVIQKWIDRNLNGLIIVKNVKPEGSTANLIQGVWNGDIPVGMNVSNGRRSLSLKAMKNIIVARSLKNAKAMKAKNRRFSTKNSDTLRYAIENYGFLIPRNQTVSMEEFAQLISETYDINNPRNRAVYDEVAVASGEITNKNGDIIYTR